MFVQVTAKNVRVFFWDTVYFRKISENIKFPEILQPYTVHITQL